ncbi:MAG: hypothetical protein L3J89_01415 [Gammaproteobacteria bacterium]|nr:hypothetical protein [Gammaproteobacteria bacterium]
MSNGFDQIISAKGTVKDQQIEKLENELQREKEGRQEDRFVALLITVMIIDLAAFPSMESWGGPVSILIIQLFLLIVAANRMGVDVIVTWLDKILNAVSPDSKPK